MPLIKSASKKARSTNIGELIHSGKDPQVAEAIAYDVQRRAAAGKYRKKKK